MENGMTDEMTQPPARQASPPKCPVHNMWIRKGKCGMCDLARMKKEAQSLHDRGIVPQPIKVIKL